MKIISLNTWGGRMDSKLNDWIRKNPADIYCFQELFSGPTLANNQAYYTDNNNQKVNLRLFETISGLLPNHTGVFSPGSRGYVHDAQWIDLPFEYGIGMFVHKSIKVLDYASGIVYGDFRDKPEGDPPLSRSAQVIRVCVNNENITLGNIHGLWEPQGKMDSPQRLAQSKKFGALVDAVAHENDGILVCGDFNLTINSKMFIQSKNNITRNLIKEIGIKSTRTHLYKKDMRFADYILANDMVNFESIQVPQEPVVSDHCPLIFSIKNQSNVQDESLAKRKLVSDLI